MGQADIIDLLEKTGKALSRTEIAKTLNSDPNRISFHLNKLIKYGEVIFEEIDRREALEKFNSKRRMRLYKIAISSYKFPNKKGNYKPKKKN